MVLPSFADCLTIAGSGLIMAGPGLMMAGSGLMMAGPGLMMVGSGLTSCFTLRRFLLALVAGDLGIGAASTAACDLSNVVKSADALLLSAYLLPVRFDPPPARRTS